MNMCNVKDSKTTKTSVKCPLFHLAYCLRAEKRIFRDVSKEDGIIYHWTFAGVGVFQNLILIKQGGIQRVLLYILS